VLILGTTLNVTLLDAPAGVVMVTGSLPDMLLGALKLIEVSDHELKELAATYVEPNFMVETPLLAPNPLPLIVIGVPGVPDPGEIPLVTGKVAPPPALSTVNDIGLLAAPSQS